MTDEDASPIPPVPTSATAAPRCALVVDADGGVHVGLFSRGLPVLAASRAELAALRTAAVAAGVFVVGFPAAGQETTDDARLAGRVGQLPASEVDYIGVGVCGGGRAVRRLTGALSLLR